MTHIDDNAISLLRNYYDQALPHNGRILDFCSSWISHFPVKLADRATRTARGEAESGETLEVIGAGLNGGELQGNPILKERIVQDLNLDPRLPESIGTLDAATCVVSIDYLVHPVETLSSIWGRMKEGGSIHLIISNRCFPTKVIGRWLQIDKAERLQMAADYLWFSGYRHVEIVTLCDGSSGQRGFFSSNSDPLWVVRGKKTANNS